MYCRSVAHGELPWWRPSLITVVIAILWPSALALRILIFVLFEHSELPPHGTARLVLRLALAGGTIVAASVSVFWLLEVLVYWIVNLLKAWLYIVSDAWEYRAAATSDGAITLKVVPASEEAGRQRHGYLCHWWSSADAIFLTTVRALSRRTRCIWFEDRERLEAVRRWLVERGWLPLVRLACEFCSEGRQPIRRLGGNVSTIPARRGSAIAVEHTGDSIPLLARVARAAAGALGDLPLAATFGMGMGSVFALPMCIGGVKKAAIKGLLDGPSLWQVVLAEWGSYVVLWWQHGRYWVLGMLAFLWVLRAVVGYAEGLGGRGRGRGPRGG